MMNKENYNQNKDFMLSCIILLFPCFMIAKYYWMFTLISAAAALLIYFNGSLFAWKRNNIEWHRRYIVSLVSSYFVVGGGGHLFTYFYVEYDIMLWYLWLCVVIVFLVEFYSVAEKERRLESEEIR